MAKMVAQQVNNNNNVAYYKGYKYNSIQRLHDIGNMHGVKRVIIFCLMTAIFPTVLIITPLYLRHSVFADVAYPVAESDVVAIMEGISSVFCESQSLRMNTTFSAFQLKKSPVLSKKRKHIRLKKSMTLPDDTLEYWGFYLLKGATVYLKVCSRYEGSRILVVRGEKNLNTCGLLEHNFKKFGATMDQDYKQVKVTFEHAQEIDDSRMTGDNAAEDLTDYDGDAEKNKLESEGGKIDERRHTRRHSRKYLVKMQELYKLQRDLKSGEDVELQVNKRNKRDGGDANKRNRRVGDESKKRNKRGFNRGLFKLQQDLKSAEDVELQVNKRNKRNADESDNKNKRGFNRELYKLQQDLKSAEDVKLQVNKRNKRDLNQMNQLDGGIEHGGNAFNYSQGGSNENSVSSFETDLLTCYDGSILLTAGFNPSESCTEVRYLEMGEHIETVHEVASDGYYYYIFYSDNDFITNDIHAIFNVHKPTYQYMNNSKTKECINVTECNFSIQFWSDETVIVEIPTDDGIEKEEDNIALLVSTCHPRMGVYLIFPISVIFLILGCAFL